MGVGRSPIPRTGFCCATRRGHLLTREELRNPAALAEATSAVPNYPKEYTYETVAHVRLARVSPALDFDKALPGWEESVDWTLLLERESFFVLCTSAFAFVVFLLLRIFLAWYADHQLKIPRFQLRSQFLRAGTTFFRAPEIK